MAVEFNSKLRKVYTKVKGKYYYKLYIPVSKRNKELLKKIKRFIGKDVKVKIKPVNL